MPEGHTIHRLAIDHRRDLVGQKLVVSSPQGRFADGAALVDGMALRAIDPVGKHLFYRFGGTKAATSTTIHVHLGLFGKFVRQGVDAATTKDTIRL